MVPKYASTGLASSSVVIPSIAARILLFAHSLYATSLRSWLLFAIAIVISPSPLWDQPVGGRRDARAPRHARYGAHDQCAATWGNSDISNSWSRRAPRYIDR